MNESLKARLEILCVEMETVTLLGRICNGNSHRQSAAQTRKIELKREISRLKESLAESHHPSAKAQTESQEGRH